MSVCHVYLEQNKNTHSGCALEACYLRHSLHPTRPSMLPPTHLKRVAKFRWRRERRMRLYAGGPLLVRDGDMQLLKVVSLVEQPAS